MALCRTKLAPLLAFTAGELAFLNGVIDRGNIDAYGLDVEAGVQERIAQMPILHWKTENVRKAKGDA
ncbi:MAG: hypothetical protein QM759_04985 [Terricaulis sp.]